MPTSMRITFSALALALVVAACSGSSKQLDELEGVSEEDRMAIRIASTEQLQVGYRIDSIAGRDDAAELCHELCHDAARSCSLGEEVCGYAAKYPQVLGLQTKCRASRDRCRSQGARVPRQCLCRS
jgi:hypothetical protein